MSSHLASSKTHQDSLSGTCLSCDFSLRLISSLQIPLIPIAFLSDIEIPFYPNPYSYPLASSPSSQPSRSSSPVFIFTSSPKLCNWFCKLTRVNKSGKGESGNIGGSIKKCSTPTPSLTNISTSGGSVKLPKLRIGLSKDAETDVLSEKRQRHSSSSRPLLPPNKPTLKRVASQPTTPSNFHLSTSQLATTPSIILPASSSSDRYFTFESTHPLVPPSPLTSLATTNIAATSSSNVNHPSRWLSSHCNDFEDLIEIVDPLPSPSLFYSTSSSHQFSISPRLPSSLPSSNAPVTTPMINQTNHGSSINIITNSYATIPGGYAPNTNNATKDTMPIPNSFSPSSSVNVVNSDNHLYQQTNNNEVESILGANNSSTLINNKYGSPSKGQFGRGSSDPDLSTTPTKPSSSHSSTCGSIGKPNIKFMISPENLHLLEYPFITMRQFPPGFIAHIGGTVSSRSVKLLDHINCPEDPETRDAWWMELRKEIRSHCRSLTCNAVLGYSEATYICDNVVILSASGTAVVLSRGGDHAQFINSNRSSTQDKAAKSDPESNSSSTNQSTGTVTTAPTLTSSANTLPVNKGEPNKSTRNHSTSDYQQSSSLPPSSSSSPNCSICHIPYPESSVPFHSSLLNCRICKKAKVSDVLFMTIEPPNNIPIVGRGCLIQARVCRNKRDSKGEQCAKELSDSLPFLEHELHRQLLSKVKVKGMNAIFGLKVQISFGENMLIALATGTAAYVGALPPPDPPQISSGKGVKTTDLNAIQKLILESMSRNREHYGLTDIPVEEREPSEGEEERNGTKVSDSDNESEYVDNYLKKVKDPALDQVLGSKDGCVVLEVDDTEDADIISLMIDSDVPKGYEICNTETMPGLSGCFSGVLQTFAQVHRVKLIAIKQFGQQFDWIIQGLFVKLRRLVPCCLTDIKFHVDLPEQDLVQVTVLGSAIGIVGSSSLGPIGKGNLYLPASSTYRRRRTLSANDSCDELLFTMDEDHGSNPDEIDDMKKENFIPSETLSESNGIELTPLSYVPGSHIQKYLGNLDFFFIRETTSIRESGGLNGFIHSFLSEVFAIVRAHVASLSGNAMVSLHLTQCVLVHNPHKNQAQCLINIAGDVVSIQNCSTKPIPVGR